LTLNPSRLFFATLDCGGQLQPHESAYLSLFQPYFAIHH
jgi:hypothetical protein